MKSGGCDHHHDHDCAGGHHHHDLDRPAAPAAHLHAPGAACNHGALGQHHPRTDAICLDRVSYHYGPTVALDDVTLHIEAGCVLGIIGPNGGGKTTLLKIMIGLLNDYRGKVSIMGMTPGEVVRRGDVVGYVPQQHQFERRFPVSVRQVVLMGLAGKSGVFGRHRREDLQRVEQLMEQVGVAELADRPIGDLSGGQQQRVFIARALAPGPKILLLDEPTVGIDPAGQLRFAELIHTLHQQHQLTVVIVSHDIRTVASGCEKVACLARTLHYHDAPSGMTADMLQEVFRHDIAVLGKE